MVKNHISNQDLSALHDIHMPKSIGWWPPAPGWYLVAVCAVLAFVLTAFLSYRYYSNGRAKREALKALEMHEKLYQQDANSQLCTARISELLKRVALTYYPRTQVAGLHGEAWIVFLNTTVKGVNFNAVRMQLLEQPWRPSQAQNLQLFFKTARKWIIKQGKPCSN